MISIICPVYNEEKYINIFIKSILKQDYLKKRFEILFIDGQSNDNTRNIIKKYINSNIRLLNNPKRNVSSAMNIGIKESKGDIVIRLDAHSIYPSNYISTLVYFLFKLEADNVGGRCITLPAKNRIICQAIALAISSPFGVGNSHFRIGKKEIRKVDTVPFGCFRKSLFVKVGFYDEELIRNQDDELNARIIKNGGSIYLIPFLNIKYYARSSIQKIAKMFYQYGLFKPLVNKKIGKITTYRQLFPALFFSGQILGFLLSPFFPSIFIVYFIVTFLYFSISIYYSIHISIKKKKYSLSLILPYIFFIIHISYGFGYWHGIFKILLNKSFNVEINR